jgi:AraC-like DNA-binding protein
MSFVTPRYESERPGRQPLWCGWTEAGRPTALDIHFHRGLEVGVVLAGEERLHFAGHTQTCRSGDVWLCNAWEPHGWRIAARHTRTVVMVFGPEFLGDVAVCDSPWLTPFAAPPSLRPRASSPELRRQVLGIGRDLRREAMARRPYWEQLVKVYLLRLLVELMRDWDHRDAPGLSTLPGAEPSELSRLMPALAAVQTCPWRRVGVKEAAAACGLSVSRFRSLFQSVLHISYGRFCMNTRLSYAAHRLVDSENTVSAVAEESGFTDGSHLHRRFVERYACTPVQFRNRRGARGPGIWVPPPLLPAAVDTAEGEISGATDADAGAKGAVADGPH